MLKERFKSVERCRVAPPKCKMHPLNEILSKYKLLSRKKGLLQMCCCDKLKLDTEGVEIGHGF